MRDLRLTAGTTAVHSAMLEWHKDETAEVAALQLLNVLFSVPQISVKLASLPDTHRKMLKFRLGFWQQHRNTFLHGSLKPYHPELNYPLIIGESLKETVIAVYHFSANN
jgi:alpha-galactosidase